MGGSAWGGWAEGGFDCDHVMEPARCTLMAGSDRSVVCKGDRPKTIFHNLLEVSVHGPESGEEDGDRDADDKRGTKTVTGGLGAGDIRPDAGLS